MQSIYLFTYHENIISARKLSIFGAYKIYISPAM